MPETLIFLLVGIWLLALSGGFVFVYTKFARLVKGVDDGNLISVLEKVLNKEDDNREQISIIARGLDGVKQKDRLHIQRVGFLKFNPFQETGGSNSFAICLLNEDNSGFVLTGLHTRERTRVYTKEIVNGNSSVELSQEETKALKKALLNTN